MGRRACFGRAPHRWGGERSLLAPEWSMLLCRPPGNPVLGNARESVFVVQSTIIEYKMRYLASQPACESALGAEGRIRAPEPLAGTCDTCRICTLGWCGWRGCASKGRWWRRASRLPERAAGGLRRCPRASAMFIGRMGWPNAQTAGWMSTNVKAAAHS